MTLFKIAEERLVSSLVSVPVLLLVLFTVLFPLVALVLFEVELLTVRLEFVTLSVCGVVSCMEFISPEDLTIPGMFMMKTAPRRTNTMTAETAMIIVRFN